MVALLKRRRQFRPRHHQFLKMLPAIQRQARFRFRHLPACAREECIAETIARCFVAWGRLAQRGKTARAYPSTLARFAMAQIRQGGRLGTPLNSHDVLSEYCRHLHGLQGRSLSTADTILTDCRSALLADTRTPVAEQAAFRIDFACWLRQLAPRQRQVAIYLALSNSTAETACCFNVTPGRISQLRRALFCDWQRFQAPLRHRAPS